MRLEVQGRRGGGERAQVGPLPPLEQRIVLRPGDTLLVTRDLAPGHPAVLDVGGQVTAPAQIGCTLPEVFADAGPASASGSTTARSGASIAGTPAGVMRLAIIGPPGGRATCAPGRGSTCRTATSASPP